MTEHLLTPSKITAWLECPHYLTLRTEVENGTRTEPHPVLSSFAELVIDKGLAHERECLAEFERQGKQVLRISERQRGEPFGEWVRRVGNPLDGDADVIYQMPLLHKGIRGIADFLVRAETPEADCSSYEPWDAKLARDDAKPGHVLQLCFYADAIEALAGAAPSQMHLWLGSGRVEPLAVQEFRPYWKRLRTQLAQLLEIIPPVGTTTPQPCDHCPFCEFLDVCRNQWRSEDSLVYVAGIRREDREGFEANGVLTLADLAEHRGGAEGMKADRVAKLVRQAALQVRARENADDPPPFELIGRTEDPVWGRGFEELPQPDNGDVFLDFEGHPFWRPDTGLFFLFGLLLRDTEGAWRYDAWWAHDIERENAVTEKLIAFLFDRRTAYPGMHVYHYNHTERSSLERLSALYSVGEDNLLSMVQTGLFVDLLTVARNAMQVGTESYGLKYLERLTEFQRSHEIDQGSGAVLEYERYMTEGDQKALQRIASYNEDDVRATLALRDWLIEHRPGGIEYRDAHLEPEAGIPELDEQVDRLHAFALGTPEHLLGDVLGYWRREWQAYVAPKLAQSQADPTELLDEPDVIASLVPDTLVPRIGKNGQILKIPAMRFKMPTQATTGFAEKGDSVVYSGGDGAVAFSEIERLCLQEGIVELKWSTKNQDLGFLPSVVVLNDWVPPRPKPEALSEFASHVLEPTRSAPSPVGMALLRHDLPRFMVGEGPSAGEFTDDIDEMMAWGPHLDQSYVAVQGPPGTGKSYRAAQLVRALLANGQRVGITAMTHNAIDNVLEKLVTVLTDENELGSLRAVRKGGRVTQQLTGVKYVDENKQAASPEFNVVAGTTWLFAGTDMRDAPVDVLVIDEAGQLALADALATVRSARNIVLFGDPRQLAQVTQAVHPDGGGKSVLEHVLDGQITMPPECGVFLGETWRMHPDVCEFISDEIYQGRLHSNPSCAQQNTVLGTGLRWLPAAHEGNSTQSSQEADIVAAELKELMGTPWTNQKGVVCPLTADDFIVVAPYNDQVNLLRSRLSEDDQLRDVQVGTVDKFQGREAAVVLFTMATSSGADMIRSANFLFSRNRLNVAISRARCLGYLVCTDRLLNSRARNIDEMRLISTLCAFVEYVDRQHPHSG
jgi:uncharacterized protein